MNPTEQAQEPPQTREGFFVLHDAYRVDWPRWRSCTAGTDIIDEARFWLERMQGVTIGDSALYSVVGQKADLLLVHYRDSVAALDEVELGFRRLRLHDFLLPASSFLSVIEVSLHEATAHARRTVQQDGLDPDSPAAAEALKRAIDAAVAGLDQRLFRKIPGQRHICFYPMSKRRDGADNWYRLPLDERRALMRGHGRIGAQYHGQVVQVVSGAIGFDDWEWGVSLHAEDPLVFKRLVTEMRFDPASSRFAEFGPFLVGIRHQPADLLDLLA